MPFEHFVAQYLMIECSLQSGQFLIEQHSLHTLTKKANECLEQVARSLPPLHGSDHVIASAESKRKAYLADQMRVAAWTIRTTIRPFTAQVHEVKQRFDEAALRKALALGSEFLTLPVDAAFWVNERWKKPIAPPMHVPSLSSTVNAPQRKFLPQKPTTQRSPLFFAKQQQSARSKPTRQRAPWKGPFA